MKIVYGLWDARYLTDEDRATCFEVCDTLKEALENKDDYGDDTVIVKETLKPVGKREFESIKSEIIKP